MLFARADKCIDLILSRRTQLCISSKLKAQSILNFSSPNKPTKGFTLLELIVTISIASIVTAIAVPNFTTIVQNNRIKSTTNNIVGSLQYARQTAAINKTTVTACTPLPSNPENCALRYQWKSGIALIQGDAKVQDFTPPPPPDEPSAPTLSLVPLPPIIAEPNKVHQ